MELTALLEKMKLEHLADQLDSVCEQAAGKDLDYKSFLAQALETEYRGRFQRGTEARIKQARFPWLKTLDQFDFDFQPSLDRKLVRELAGLFFRLLARRYERASLIVTSNKSFLDWGEIFQDHVLATAILDRLLHHATTLNIKGESYRLKEKKRAGLLGQAPQPQPEEAMT